MIAEAPPIWSPSMSTAYMFVYRTEKKTYTPKQRAALTYLSHSVCTWILLSVPCWFSVFCYRFNGAYYQQMPHHKPFWKTLAGISSQIYNNSCDSTCSIRNIALHNHRCCCCYCCRFFFFQPPFVFSLISNT